MILSVDLGTSVTKVGLWDRDGLVAMSRSNLTTRHAPGGRAEQEPAQWWNSVREACVSAIATGPRGRGVEVIGFSGARQTFVPVDSELRPLGAGLLWSDRRAPVEASTLAARHGGVEELHRRTGAYLDSGAVASKVAWLATHESERLRAARWLLSPRDLCVSKMTGNVSTDLTMASASGLYGTDGTLVYDLAGELALCEPVPFTLADLLPDVAASSRVVGSLLDEPARELGLDTGIPVVIGAGDRQCEVLGAGASPLRPMVSWGTTANFSVPLDAPPDPIPRELVLTRAATAGWLLEGGLSSAGSLLDWIARITTTDPPSLVEQARRSPPGARGVLVMPWIGGARAPWWRDACASVVGLSAHCELGDLARAAIEGVAFDVARCLESAFATSNTRPPDALALAGGSNSDVWLEVLTGVTGLPAIRRRSGEAASAGAAILAGQAAGLDLDLETMDPVVSEVCPNPGDVERYGLLRQVADEVATSLISMPTVPASR